jgi:hypothetical protein
MIEKVRCGTGYRQARSSQQFPSWRLPAPCKAVKHLFGDTAYPLHAVRQSRIS